MGRHFRKVRVGCFLLGTAGGFSKALPDLVTGELQAARHGTRMQDPTESPALWGASGPELREFTWGSYVIMS